MNKILENARSFAGQPTYADLIIQNQELREEVRNMREILVPIIVAPSGFGMTPREWDLTSCLYANSPKIMSRQALLEAMYPNNASAPEMKIIDVFICKIRKKIKPHGMDIGLSWGKGYFMPPESASVLRALLDQQQKG
jgi:two-component system cell cycle response regulator CtrA